MPECAYDGDCERKKDEKRAQGFQPVVEILRGLRRNEIHLACRQQEDTSIDPVDGAAEP
jgi:hypothetical protein